MSWFSKMTKKKQPPEAAAEAPQLAEPAVDLAIQATTLEVDFPPSDPLLAYLLSGPGVIEIERLNLDSPTLRQLKDAKVRLSVPLISQGELIGLINLGPRMSEADYSSDDRRMLNTLAVQAAPALRVAQLARQQQIEALERERMEQELRVARVIQQTLLPKEVPSLPGWSMAAHWQPARAVSGDFYDFIAFPDGKLAIIVADVTDKGVPAALVMATTRSILRTAAERLESPGAVLKQTNNQLCPNIPENMFVTCLYALLDPTSGVIRYANAGHNIPFQRQSDGVVDMRARGMPLGLMPDMEYEEKESLLGAGEYMLMYSDGMTEAHNPQGEMFGTPRLRELINMPKCGSELISCMLEELKAFTGPEWEQEDDVTFVTLERLVPGALPDAEILAEFSILSQLGNEKQAMDQVAASVAGLNIPKLQLERLKTAVAEATMNAMEHGNHYQLELPVEITVLASDQALTVAITDHSGGRYVAGTGAFEPAETPDLDAKLAGLQSPRGWGLFLIQKMVDEMRVTSDQEHHTVELILYRKGEK